MIAILLVSAALLLPGATSAQPLTAQQERMKSCNAEASRKHLIGDARHNFMSDCPKGEMRGERGRLSAQQEKMKTCNREASGRNLKADKRLDFISACLSAERQTSAAGGR
jgi:hypothetical protein